ncbi:MAG: hypothetical protein NTV21_14905 [Planctomycetota bacterium]|nr:hypothetical protein [Planctomycetota bacterium]
MVAAFVMSARGSGRRIGGLFSELELRFKDGTVSTALTPTTTTLVKQLLDSETGRERLVELDARRDDFAFDSARGYVYWVAPESGIGADPKYGIHSVGRELGGHCGIGYPIRLHGVRCDGTRLLFELETLESYRKPTSLKGVWPAEPGRRYEAVVELASLDRGYVTTKNFSECRPLER